MSFLSEVNAKFLGGQDNFIFWKNEIADMPTLQNGKWVDLETGLEFDSSFDYKPKNKPNKPNNNKSYTTFAKKFGGKALTGTSKQKEWAEKIRYNCLQTVPEAQAKLLCTIGFFSTAKFWIENRDDKTLGKKAEELVVLVAKANEKNKMVRSDPRNNELLEEYDLILKEIRSLFTYINV